MPVLVEKKNPTCKEKVALRTTFPVRREGGGNVVGHPASPNPILRARIAPLRWPLQKWRQKSHSTPSYWACLCPWREGKTKLYPPGPKVRKWPMMSSQSSGRQPPGPLSDSALTPHKGGAFPEGAGRACRSVQSALLLHSLV